MLYFELMSKFVYDLKRKTYEVTNYNLWTVRRKQKQFRQSDIKK